MDQFFPNTVQDIVPTRANENNGLNVPPQPDFDTPAMQGSLQQALSENLGQFVVVEFLIGTQSIQTKSGILYAVGNSVLTLYEEATQTFVICDMFSVKFVTFYLPGQRPQRYAGPYNGVTPAVPADFGPVMPGPGGGVIFSGTPNIDNMNGMGGARNGMNGMNRMNNFPGMG
ncbi:hypothetical protein [Clostridium sp. D33t1_170424_F3]|uniref:hypothetical protein n=1 Tax=Clostridium sp. D33t1_170424_F3 TaxID=2787099 RepID=UPI0018AA293B|nr:hypothetical protein [Clostridium sp. D33t1_170424_F3]